MPGVVSPIQVKYIHNLGKIKQDRTLCISPDTPNPIHHPPPLETLPHVSGLIDMISDFQNVLYGELPFPGLKGILYPEAIKRTTRCFPIHEVSNTLQIFRKTNQKFIKYQSIAVHYIYSIYQLNPPFS